MFRVQSTTKCQSTVDKVENIQRKVATIIGHVFKLVYAGFCDELIHKEKVNHCNGCTIPQPSQGEHSCLMMDTEDARNYYHDEAREQVDLAIVMKTVESICRTLGFKLGQTWESYLTELPKFPWTAIYLTSLELDHCDQDVKSGVLHTLWYGCNGLKLKDSSACELGEACDEDAICVDKIEVECPETIARKEELKNLDVVINEIQNKLYF